MACPRLVAPVPGGGWTTYRAVNPPGQEGLADHPWAINSHGDTTPTTHRALARLAPGPHLRQVRRHVIQCDLRDMCFPARGLGPWPRAKAPTFPWVAVELAGRADNIFLLKTQASLWTSQPLVVAECCPVFRFAGPFSYQLSLFFIVAGFSLENEAPEFQVCRLLSLTYTLTTSPHTPSTSA